MSAGRILLLLVVVATVAWLVRSSGLLAPVMPASEPGGKGPPVERARKAARAAGARNTQAEAASREFESQPAGGAVSENMTPDQVRALLGPPDSAESDTTDAGVARERWTYRSAGKTVVFENGVVVRIE
jgi:hypothetical protein